KLLHITFSFVSESGKRNIFMTTAITLILTQWVDLGNPCDQVVAKISDLKILVIDNIFVLEKMSELCFRRV
ncbi:MAG: hypothetical protein KAI93_14105, partial [Desulfobacterales bacterium]|nr:hypothetical protein [Desulfobacterales bacterium]